MKVYIILSNGYEEGRSIIEGVYREFEDAKEAIRDLRRKQDPLDDWLYYTLHDEEVREVY